MLLAFVLVITFIGNCYSQSGWVTATKIGEGLTQYIQGNQVKECKYTVEGRFNFSVMLSGVYVCPYQVEYNLATKEVKY